MWFRGLLHETNDIMMPSTDWTTFEAFLNKYKGQYCCMMDYNFMDIVHAHSCSTYYRTRLMSDEKDGLFIGAWHY